MTIITRDQIQSVADIVGPRDFAAFAEGVAAIDEIAGVLAALHADAADGNSPDVQDCVDGTFADRIACDDDSVESAREWWLRQYCAE